MHVKVIVVVKKSAAPPPGMCSSSKHIEILLIVVSPMGTRHCGISLTTASVVALWTCHELGGSLIWLENASSRCNIEVTNVINKSSLKWA